jgi:hypothetical protein
VANQGANSSPCRIVAVVTKVNNNQGPCTGKLFSMFTATLNVSYNLVHPITIDVNNLRELFADPLLLADMLNQCAFPDL